jgi:hypothetical protein
MSKASVEYKMETPIGYAYEALVCSWEGDSIALTIDEARRWEQMMRRTRDQGFIDQDTAEFVRMTEVQQDKRWVQRYPTI